MFFSDAAATHVRTCEVIHVRREQRCVVVRPRDELSVTISSFGFVTSFNHVDVRTKSSPLYLRHRDSWIFRGQRNRSSELFPVSSNKRPAVLDVVPRRPSRTTFVANIDSWCANTCPTAAAESELLFLDFFQIALETRNANDAIVLRDFAQGVVFKEQNFNISTLFQFFIFLRHFSRETV